MAEARYETTTGVPIETIWRFVEDMDHWARFVMGYQTHEKKSDTESVWTLKGDLGVMSRTLTFAVRITEWTAPSRVRFTLAGLNEPMSGEGAFTIEPASAADPAGAAAGSASAVAVAASVPPAPREGLVLRWLQALWRRLLRAFGGGAERRAAPAPAAVRTRLGFELRLDPGGPMAPMINAMIKPLLLPAAEQLADRILAHLEVREGLRVGGRVEGHEAREGTMP